MIHKPAPGDERRPAILVSDAAPLSLLATIPGALHWLFVPGCEVWIPDIILDEAFRNPEEGKDQRIERRAEVAGWAQRNRYRIKRLETRIGKRYDAEMQNYGNAMDLWQRAGSSADLEPLRPEWADRGDQSVWVGVNMTNDELATGESVIALADDHNIRAAIEARGAKRGQRPSTCWVHKRSFSGWQGTLPSRKRRRLGTPSRGRGSGPGMLR